MSWTFDEKLMGKSVGHQYVNQHHICGLNFITKPSGFPPHCSFHIVFHSYLTQKTPTQYIHPLLAMNLLLCYFVK